MHRQVFDENSGLARLNTNIHRQYKEKTVNFLDSRVQYGSQVPSRKMDQFICKRRMLK
jgi:hypothetical protein